MAYVLCYMGRDYPLGEGRFVIGRSEECHLCLDDPLASRNHAALIVEMDAVRVEDLQSRNGVFVNQIRIVESKRLNDGDRVQIGSQELTLVRRDRSANADTLMQSRPVTSRLQAFGLLGGLADKALGMGRSDEAERILGRLLEQFLAKAESGTPLTDEEFQRSSDYAVRIVTVGRNGKWLDYLFRLHAAQQRLMDGELVNELYSIAPKAHGASRSQLRAYLESLHARGGSLAPGQRFVLKRIEGLEAVLS